MKPDLQYLREKCPLPVIMQRLGLERYAKSSCPSPFRPDEHASWGIFQHNGHWLFKDFATGECGDEIAFLAQYHKLDNQRDFLKLLDLYQELANRSDIVSYMTLPEELPVFNFPDLSFLEDGTEEQIRRLSILRHISLPGLQYAADRGHLRFGHWRGHEVFGVVDESELLGEIRRLDGLEFPGFGSFPSHKSHTIKHSRKNWPLGILDAEDCTGVALVEGLPDFLAMHQFIVEADLRRKVGAVAMLTSSCDISADTIHRFQGKYVRIFPHQDQPGIDAAERWQRQLINAKAEHVDFFNFRAIEVGPDSKLKDLCDFNQHRGAGQPTINILENLAL